MLKKTLLILLVLALLAGVPALSEGGAALENGQLRVTWDACPGSGTLAVYRDGWPVLTQTVDCAAGGCLLPGWCVSSGGTYTIRLTTNRGCQVLKVAPGASAAPAPAATPAPAKNPVPTATPTPRSGGTQFPSRAAQLVAETNVERARYGLGLLTEDAELTRAACVRAGEIARSFSHTRPDGSAWSTVSASALAENIAMGYGSADKTVAAWMTSEGHRANILRAHYTKIGICALEVNGIMYWVQLFGR